MNWLIWRQYRKQLLIFIGILGIFAAVAVPFGLHFWNHYQDILRVCTPTNSCKENEIRDVVFSTTVEGLAPNFVKLSLLVLPLFLGLFWGVPLIAKEYAENTNKLAWTQGISRRRWLTVKLAWALLAAAVYAGIFAALATWFSRTGNAINHDRFNELAFSSQGIVPVAATVFAVAAGAMFGAWFKKLLPALGVTLGLLLVVQIAVPLLVRPHYQDVQTYTVSLNKEFESRGRHEFAPQGPAEQDWAIDTKQVDRLGKALDPIHPPQQCIINEDKVDNEVHTQSEENKPRSAAFSLAGGPIIQVDCLVTLGYNWEVKYQPGYRYWNFQRIEAALYLAMTGLAVGATYWLVSKRDA